MTDDRLRVLLAHDLRNPLSVITGYAELLKLRDDPETRVEAAENILVAAYKLSLLFDELLERLGPASPPPG